MRCAALCESAVGLDRARAVSRGLGFGLIASVIGKRERERKGADPDPDPDQDSDLNPI